MIPSIESGRVRHETEMLRNRRMESDRVHEEVVARLKEKWQASWCQIPLSSTTPAQRQGAVRASVETSPFMASTLAPTGGKSGVVGTYHSQAVLDAMAMLSTRTIVGIRRDQLVWLMHCLCCLIHTVMAIVVFAVSANAVDPWLPMYRQRFLFTRNTSECGILTNFTDDPSPPIAVLVDNGLKLHVGVASAFFFVLSALAHGLWVYAYFNRRLWEKLFGWLVDAWVPTRWAEYSISASLMFLVLNALSGLGRNEAVAASGFVLIGTTMMFGYLTETLSRPDPDSQGRLWMGQREDGSNRFANYVWRCHPHVLGTIPYFAAWVICFKGFMDTIADVEELFGDRISDFIPTFLVSAFIAVFGTFSTFSFCQLYFQWRPPSSYWATEVIYCILSATSKLLLGGILLANVLLLERASDGTAGD